MSKILIKIEICFSETLDVQTFHYIQMQIEQHLEMIVTDKLEGRSHAKR